MKINILVLCIVFFAGCSADYTPKPLAFFKIDLPNKEYQKVDVDCPFVFETPLYSSLEKNQRACFYNLDFPNQNGVLHITYLPLKNDLREHTEFSRKLAYKHNVMADAITEQVYINEEEKVYGVLYNYDGITATAAQFYLTDSVHHFFRGALYFSTEVSDSLLPVNNFLKQDVKHLIETFHWKDN
jgi:gliding motility-associated lipoprotein GldD